MAYQELDVVKAVKAGILDLESRRVVWDNTTYEQGLKYRNDGKIILYAVSVHTIDEGNATWSATLPQAGTYSVLLEKTGGGDTDGSIHLQFTPDPGTTLQDLQDAIDTGAGGALDPVWSFYHKNSAVNGNFGQFELYFEDPVSTAWLEVTILPCQGLAPGSGAWEDEVLTGAVIAGIGGNTPNGSSVFGWPPPGTLVTLLTDINGLWDTAEQDQVATNYELKRVRIELWEANPARTAYIDDVVIDGTTYAVEPGLVGAEIGPNTDVSTLAFVEVPDRFGRLEVLNPILGAEQALLVGPLLPELFNDSDGFVRFKPSSTGVDYTYVAIQVTDPS